MCIFTLTGDRVFYVLEAEFLYVYALDGFLRVLEAEFLYVYALDGFLRVVGMLVFQS
jgi:hypothetical protein